MSPVTGLHGKTPYEKLFKSKVDASWFRLFVCIAYTLIPKDKCKNKLASKVRKSVMLGYVPGKKAYRLYDPITRTVFTSCHVNFNENRDINVSEFIGKNLEDKGPAAEQWEDLC